MQEARSDKLIRKLVSVTRLEANTTALKRELAAVRNEDYGGTEGVESTAHRWPGTPAQEQGSSNMVSVQSATLPPVVPIGTQPYNAGHPNMQELQRASEETTDFGTADAPSAKRRRRH